MMSPFLPIFLTIVSIVITAIVSIALIASGLIAIYFLKWKWRKHYQKWTWSPISTIDRRNHLSWNEFIQNYASVGKPVVITDIVRTWAAFQKWSYDFFKVNYGPFQCDVRDCHIDAIVPMAMADYMDYMKSGKRDRLLYLSQWAIFPHPELYKDYQAPNYFSNWLEKLPRKLQQKYGVTYSTLYIGPKGTGTNLHIDNRNTSAWLAVLSGQKRFIFFSPDQEPFLYDGAVDVLNPDLERFPLYAKAKPVEIILEAGDLVYFPSKWWHQVENLEDSIALSHNLVDEWNAEVVLQSAFDESPAEAHVFQFICEFPWLGKLLALAS